MKALERKKALTPLAMQDPCDKAKLGLLNPSFQRSNRRPSDTTAPQGRAIRIQPFQHDKGMERSI